MIARERGRDWRLAGLVLLMGGAVALAPASAQGPAAQRIQVPVGPGGAPAEVKEGPDGQIAVPPNAVRNLNQINIPPLKQTRMLVSPSDAIAVVNKDVITRQQLADECVAQEGKKVLDALINRLLIEQALKAKKLAVSPADVDEEIDTTARRFGVSREAWLRTLDKERGISPAQYVQRIIYPALALRKLSVDRVQVTPEDLSNAFEAQYGEKVRCRMILVDSLNKAQGIWEQLRKNPGGFEKLAKEQSMDSGSRSLGGLLAQPIARHAYPQDLSRAVFEQLVDGDPQDHDPSHKPKDGDFTGPIQAGETAWVVLRREELLPGAKDASLKDERIRKQVYEMIYQVKLKEAMEKVFQDLITQAEVENRLTGTVKMANEVKDSAYGADPQVKRIRGEVVENGGKAPNPRTTAAGKSKTGLPRPVALSPEAARNFRPLKPGGGPAPAKPATGANASAKTNTNAPATIAAPPAASTNAPAAPALPSH